MEKPLNHIKWSPLEVKEHRVISLLKDKHKVVGNDVMETTLQEGYDFINTNTRMNMNMNMNDTDNKRENHFTKINERELIAQTNLNPFLNSNYLDDLQIQQDFLTPQNSNMFKNTDD